MARLPRWAFAILLTGLLAPAALAGTFGTVVPIGGHASDIALDEARGVVYVANYTANRIEVVSLKTRTIQSSWNVARQPGSLALSPDGRFLVITHLSNFQAPTPSGNAVTVMDLNGNVRRTFAFGAAPLGVAFGYNGMALVATTKDLLLFDPATGYMETVDTFASVTAKALPVPSGTAARDVIRASVTASADGAVIYGTAEVSDDEAQVVLFQYGVGQRALSTAYWIASPPLGPRVVSVDQNGGSFMTGWGLFHARGFLLAQLPNASGKFAVGSHAIDSVRNTVYVHYAEAVPNQVPPSPICQDIGGTTVCVTPPSTGSQNVISGPPLLLVADADNFTVRERLRLPENLSGRSLLSSNRETMYSVSDSGLMILPVGTMAQVHRVSASQEDVVIRGSFCDRNPISQEISIVNPGGGKTDFSLAANLPGVTISPAGGTTPAKVRITVDPNAFQNQKGTVVGQIEIRSSAAVNVPANIRLLINNREPDQRGTFVNVAGKLVDLLADQSRNRFYVLRQDRNEVLVFDANNYKQLAALRTGNTPWQMAITNDRQYLIVGADNSQVAHVYNLDTLKFDRYIIFPSGHYPRSIAASGGAILAATRVSGPKHKIDRVSFWSGTAVELPTLGIFENDIDVDTVLTASPSGSSILVTQANGNVMLYDANSDTFVASRKDFDELSGAYAALSDDYFVVDNHVLNSSLYPIRDLETGTGSSSGIAATGTLALRTTAPEASSPGVIQKVDLAQAAVVRPTRMTEAPLIPTEDQGGFTRTLAPLANGNAIVSLSTSGFTVLPWEYDAAVATPAIERVTNAADRTSGVAPGALISIWGRDLNPITMASNEVPLPTALADSCITINGSTLVPVIFVSPGQINAQLPFNVSGEGTMILHTPSGVSNSFRFPVKSTAPSVFLTNVDYWTSEVPTVVRSVNSGLVTLSNPIHGDDWIVIYATGLGLTAPAVATGSPGPAEAPLAEALVLPEVRLGDVPLPVGYAGMVPGLVGVYQINAYVPFKGIPGGMEVPLTIKQGDYTTTLNVRVVK